MAQIEYACRDVVFHFNKKHLEDSTVPMWVLKTHGETFYVNHVECSIPWSTKETPENSHTKGSIKVKNALLQINDDNNATLKKLTKVDQARLKNQRLGITRIIAKEGAANWQLQKTLKEHKIKHSPIKSIGGACTSTFYICDILDKQELTFLLIKMAGTDCRILQPNEGYYKVYDDPKYRGISDIDMDAYDYDDDLE